jgi:hypothetical protein
MFVFMLNLYDPFSKDVKLGCAPLLAFFEVESIVQPFTKVSDFSRTCHYLPARLVMWGPSPPAKTARRAVRRRICNLEVQAVVQPDGLAAGAEGNRTRLTANVT